MECSLKQYHVADILEKLMSPLNDHPMSMEYGWDITREIDRVKEMKPFL